ncbi:MAG: bifunctional phosphopantothenoylcysteine decarboxylase/phosphopantothenate--cysteine ligase CoaBC, partial [Parvularculaceae bacterium]|nr:bifunctional phosphopantothenoylcysteine decarboxylase/phosphopantothenate--cysteine ligase CoaBC [Parvularculaceae bacterium]
NNKTYTDLFDLTDEAEMGHIQLSRAADLVVIAPATADLLAKMANGLADDLASTALLATDKPVLAAPAMNVQMWRHAATQRNIKRLRDDGVRFVGPNEGDMACGEFGPGRMAEPREIADVIEGWFVTHKAGPLSGLTALVTAGPTHEPLDPVRYIANRSSGKQGYAIAGALARMGAKVTLVSGPTNLPTPPGVKFLKVETARQMLEAVETSLPADIAVFCAAVADYRPEIETGHKIKKERGGLSSIALAENPDILKTVSHLEHNRPGLVIGFAAETDDVISHARAKRARKNCDWIVANDVSAGEACAMGGELNAVAVITADGEEMWPTMPKVDVAQCLAEKIADTVNARKKSD